MTETTPYDADRARFTRQALARLVLCDHAADVADGAAGLVATENDADTGPGGRVSQAFQLIELAERALISAVIYERERGSSWTEIAQYLGIGPAEAEERFGANLDNWNTAFQVPYRLDGTGRKRIPQLPTAAYDPAWACDRLDTWASNRLNPCQQRASRQLGSRQGCAGGGAPVSDPVAVLAGKAIASSNRLRA